MSSLPAGYKQVEYIESSGTQYIDTTFYPNQDSRIVVDVVLISYSSNSALFGARNGDLSEFWAYYRPTDSGFCCRYGDGGASDHIASGTPSERNVIDMNKNVLSVSNGGVTTAETATVLSSYPAYILAVNNAGTATLFSSAKLYSCQIYDNGTLVHDLIPCYQKSDNTAGLYDTVNGGFYTNAGTGTFAIGPEISEPVVITGGLMPFAFALRRRLLSSGGTKFDDVKATFSVSGGMEDTAVVVDGVNYRLLKITKSGTLTFDKKANVSICLVGGGGNGAKGPGGGGGGGFMAHVLGMEKVQNLTFSIGAATQATTVSGDASGTANGGSSANRYSGGSGGCGGGAVRKASYNSAVSNGTPGTGDGKSKYPFGITSLLAHCAGGGAGGYYAMSNIIDIGYSVDNYPGGNGGSNGGSGTLGGTTGGARGGYGGTYGGGNGGRAPSYEDDTGNEYRGQNATFYGGGGGGGSYGTEYDADNDWAVSTTGGSGYQGVAYVIDGLFPANV